MFGHLQCVNGYSKDLAKAVFREKTMMNFDSFLYILGIPIMILTLFNGRNVITRFSNELY